MPRTINGVTPITKFITTTSNNDPMNMVVFPLIKHDTEFGGANSNDCYYVLNATHEMTIKGVRFSFANPSTNSVRWGLYRGYDSNAQRVAETSILSGIGASKGITEMLFTGIPPSF
jgi:hypothetical protein